ncbi:MAG: tRNA (adenosine(37)-N6)-threonylcarbamoyltransferase complex dimerization subunit type 1 TsaB [Pirellulales bacterium]|nr:tRNA (adenosine(37)-N6)-threonylcarbamoyltransferase complex dimerization subunit type 1 TsaB [Pirellulales bacterium]
MHILALETSSSGGSVAAHDGANLLQEVQLNPRQRSAQSLVPAIVELLGQVDWTPQDVDLVAVTVGSGSFTGLRVGVTTAKTFAYAVGAEILGIDTLETIAAGIGKGQEERAEPSPASAAVVHQKTLITTPSPLHVALDAQRGDLITQTFLPAPDGWFRPQGVEKLLPAERWLQGLAPGGMIAGPVLGKLLALIPGHLTVLPEPLWHPQARHVARLAARDYAAGRRDDLWQLFPRYSRRSAAEEKWEAAQRS